jgi:acyl-CoA reductase-like NAD-dependent aldehyde dehydrogenase
VFQHLVLSHAQAGEVIAGGLANMVCFTGSVAGGKAMEEASAGRFINVGLELGGKDPAYVRPDVDMPHAVENLVDGAFFNSGQSCCGVERIYVHKKVWNDFLDGFVDLTKKYVLGSPLEETTTLGPMVRTEAATFVRKQIASAVRAGAKTHVDPKSFAMDKAGTPYMAPQVLTGVTHKMSVMMDESFGPVVGIMKVSDDREAIELMNDSPYGLTASVWTQDVDAAQTIGDEIATGTVFMNRCDYLDPALTWTGVKDTGRGATLSKVGYEALTRPKSYHLRTKT